VQSEVLGSGNCEWPRIDDRLLCGSYRHAWVARAKAGEFFASVVVRNDMHGGAEQSHDFGNQVYCSEPYFISRPGAGHEEGWIATECLDTSSGKSFLAVLDAAHLADGPQAVIHLEHHVPYSYHGCWRAAG
jgi:all-trans-8'-apo-beta-carotenal 15,15'-oxygenase